MALLVSRASFTYANSNEQLVYVQIEPWANVYAVKQGQEFTIVFDTQGEPPNVVIQEYRETRIVSLSNISDYFIASDGKLIHWKDFASDV